MLLLYSEHTHKSIQSLNHTNVQVALDVIICAPVIICNAMVIKITRS